MTSEQRSKTMRAVHSKDTGPEMVVRRMLHSLGYRFQLHRSDLPGTPDIVLPKRRRVIFVNGCFWHGHDCARGARPPKANAEYWRTKIARNQTRDAAHLKQLADQGWQTVTLWECEIRDKDRLAKRLTKLLGRK